MRSQGCIKYWINVFHILRYKSVFVGLWVAERHLPRGRGLVISRNKTFFHTILYCDETVIGYGVLILLSSSRWRVVNVCPWKLFWCGSKRLSCVLIEWGHRRWYGLKIQWTLSKSTIFFLSKCKLWFGPELIRLLSIVLCKCKPSVFGDALHLERVDCTYKIHSIEQSFHAVESLLWRKVLVKWYLRVQGYIRFGFICRIKSIGQSNRQSDLKLLTIILNVLKWYCVHALYFLSKIFNWIKASGLIMAKEEKW